MADKEKIWEIIRKLIVETDSSNFEDTTEKMGKVLFHYKDTGGKGKDLYEYLLDLTEEFKEDQWKDEVLLDTMDRIMGYSEGDRNILFKDYDIHEEEWKS